MSKRRFRKLKEKTKDELKEALAHGIAHLLKLRLAHAQHEPVITAEFWKSRKDIAMIKTIFSQRAKEQE